MFRSMSVLICLLLPTSLPAEELTWPPKLPGDKQVATDTSPDFLQPTETLRAGVKIATAAPTIDFMYYPDQTYLGHPWSVWGDGSAQPGKYYSAIGDHGAPAGNAFVYEYDAEKKQLRKLLDLDSVLNLPEGHYSPSKIHTRVDRGSDGWLYFGTHRGSTRVTIDKYHYQGDWIVRHNPDTGKSEVVAHGPVPKHCIPTGQLDPERLIFYAGTQSGEPGSKDIHFLAYDVKNRKVLQDVPGGPYRYLIIARSTGRVYFTPVDNGTLYRYDPATNEPPRAIEGSLGLRAATDETKDGLVYTVASRSPAMIYRFNTKDESIAEIGTAEVGEQSYITSLDVDPTGRYLYYIPGAHGGSERDGTAVVQFDLKTKTKKVIAFLHPFYQKKYGYVPIGSFSSALDPAGDKLYVTWNGSRNEPRRGRYDFDTCAMTVIHIPESER